MTNNSEINYVMLRLLDKTVSSMCGILFSLIERYEIYEEDYELKVKALGDYDIPDEYLLNQVNEFVELICIFLGDDELELGDKKSLTQIQTIMFKELAQMESLNDPKYMERLNLFFSQWINWSDDIKIFFETVIQKAIKNQKIGESFLNSPNEFLDKFNSFHEQVITIYEQNNGEPNEKPSVACPFCDEQIKGYACAWGYNKHVHLNCEECGSAMME
jgi:hypothetical protein